MVPCRISPQCSPSGCCLQLKRTYGSASHGELIFLFLAALTAARIFLYKYSSLLPRDGEVWYLVGLITRRPGVQIPLPLPFCGSPIMLHRTLVQEAALGQSRIIAPCADAQAGFGPSKEAPAISRPWHFPKVGMTHGAAPA